MPTSRSSAQAKSSIGGLTAAALAPDRKDIGKEARSARWQRYLDKVLEALPHLADDPEELNRRAELLRRADMTRSSGCGGLWWWRQRTGYPGVGG